KSRISSFLGERVAVADAAREYLDSDRSGARFGYRPFHDFKGSVWARDLHHTHRRHEIPPTVSRHLTLSCRIIGRFLGSFTSSSVNAAPLPLRPSSGPHSPGSQN